MKVKYQVVSVTGALDNNVVATEVVIGEFEFVKYAEQFKYSLPWSDPREVQYRVKKIIHCPLCESFTNTSLVLIVKHMRNEHNVSSLINAKRLAEEWVKK